MDTSELAEATLTLHRDDYEAWLRDEAVDIAGVSPSARENPLAEYIAFVTGVHFHLQTNVRRAWFLLQLTRVDAGHAHTLQMWLPDWTTSLVMEYTAYPTRRFGTKPTLTVSKYQALDDLKRLLDHHGRQS